MSLYACTVSITAPHLKACKTMIKSTFIACIMFAKSSFDCGRSSIERVMLVI